MTVFKNGKEKEMSKPSFFASILNGDDDYKNTDNQDIQYQVRIIECPECGHTEEDETGYKVKEGTSNTALICDKCKEKKEDKELYESFIKTVPTIYRDNLTDNIKDHLIYSTNSIIFGNYGTGKTNTAYSVAKKLFMSKKITGYKIVREVQILNELRGDTKNDWTYKDTPFLVIDEFGKVNDTEFSKAQIFNIIDHRNDWGKKTLLICNASDEKTLKTIIPVAIMDRFKKCVIYMGGESKR